LEEIMNLSAPKGTTFMLDLLVAILALVSNFVVLPVISAYAFWLLLLAFIILMAGVLFKGV